MPVPLFAEIRPTHLTGFNQLPHSNADCTYRFLLWFLQRIYVGSRAGTYSCVWSGGRHKICHWVHFRLRVDNSVLGHYSLYTTTFRNTGPVSCDALYSETFFALAEPSLLILRLRNTYSKLFLSVQRNLQ
jgi:hypothetical protein